MLGESLFVCLLVCLSVCSSVCLLYYFVFCLSLSLCKVQSTVFSCSESELKVMKQELSAQIETMGKVISDKLSFNDSC